uniref:Photosystem I reaction center subunit PsaK n=1 Tax=Thuretia quercifolia TaxID=189650 RepID=A0A1Z1MKP8_9FLOR|nr:photosystem I reaction center subunit X [Thuretia quercifolia]ARW66375.1 photosystem I reaction center subunit X [Thuretia quercifolia]
MNIYTNLFLVATSNSTLWSVKIGIIMIICNLISIGLGRYAITTRSLGPSIPILGLEGLGLAELLATTSLGHIIGAGTIIGLRSIQII